jgi:hypothetical protein
MNTAVAVLVGLLSVTFAVVFTVREQQHRAILREEAKRLEYERHIELGRAAERENEARRRAQSSERRAWVTLLLHENAPSGSSSAPVVEDGGVSITSVGSVLALVNSLKRSHSAYSLVVMYVAGSVSVDNLKRLAFAGCHLRRIEPIALPPQVKAEQADGWMRLRAFELTDACDACVFVSGSSIALSNIDNVFDSLSAGSAFVSTSQLQVSSGAAPDFAAPITAPALRASSNIALNLALFAYRPSTTTLSRLQAILHRESTHDSQLPLATLLSDLFTGRLLTLPFEYCAPHSMWQAERLDPLHRQSTAAAYTPVKAVVYGREYGLVPWADNKQPLVTPEDPRQIRNSEQLWWAAYGYTPRI